MVLTFRQISRTIPAQAGEAGGDFKFKVKDSSSVSDPYGIHLERIRIQHFRLHTDPDRIRIQSVSTIQGLDDQKLKKNLQLKNFFCIFWIKNYNLPIARPS